MHVLFLAPEQPAPHRDYVLALKRVGARVSGVGHLPKESVDPLLAKALDGYVAVRSLADPRALLTAARQLGRPVPIDRIEGPDERLTEPAAELRQALGVPGLTPRSATLCRDKTAMKDALRAAGVPCAASAAVGTLAEAQAFAERIGYPLILKPRAGLGAQKTFRVDDDAQLVRAARELALGSPGASAAIEEFVEGHEGFYDTLTVGGVVRHEFVAHYYPTVLKAMGDRSIAPQIATTNRIDAPGYDELKTLGAKVIAVLGIDTSATHMEWFVGPKGLRFSEIGARPPGERIWDLHCAGNDFDLYREWALAITGQASEARPSRRFATGSVQVRPDQDGKIVGYRGLGEVHKQCGEWIHASQVPAPGTPTRPMRLGYLENTWFRLHHPDYDQVRRMMDFIGSTVQVTARGL